jgi:hypothetical protein
MAGKQTIAADSGLWTFSRAGCQKTVTIADVQGPQTHRRRFINLYKHKEAYIKKMAQKALDGKCKFDRTEEEGRCENWTFLMIGTCKPGED